jgi:hypothetical protein
VSAHGYDKPEKLEISIKGEEKSSDGHQKFVTLSGNSTEILEYDVSFNYSEIQDSSSLQTFFYIDSLKTKQWTIISWKQKRSMEKSSKKKSIYT